jgi:hypothetical protein
MPRLHLIEIAEQPWCPRAIRDGLTDFLRVVIDAGGAYAPAAPLLADLLRRTGSIRIVDLCSGGGGPWRSMVPALAAEGVRPAIRLTDLHPNVAAFATFARELPGVVSGEPRPVDARAVPADLAGLRTLFTALHHFRAADARALFADAAERGVPIGVFESTRRDVTAILVTLLSPIVVLLVTPRIRPFRWSRLVLTYLLPAIPLVVLFDGIVSCLRSYTRAELEALVRGVGEGRMRWQVGEAGRGPVPMSYVIGEPVGD